MVKKTTIILLLLVSLFGFAFQVKAVTDRQGLSEEYQLNLYRAKVLRIIDTVRLSGTDDNNIIQIAEIKILNRDYKGLVTEIRSTLTGNDAYDIKLKEGMRISVHAEDTFDGSVSFYIINYERTNFVLGLLTFFILCILIIGGIKGLKALVSLSITILLIIYALIPLLLKGYNPIVISVLICTLSTVITLLIIAGFNKKSLSAIIGTIGGLLIGGIIAYIFGQIARLTGFSSTDAQMLLYLPGYISFDFRGLLFAGIIIGALGACMDVSISLASSLTEIQMSNPLICTKKLIQSGFNIGKDIMGTMINTLVLAYTGGTLSTMLIFVGFEKTASEIVNLDSIVTEILRAIAGSIGLLFSIPITIFAFIIITKKSLVKKEG